MFVNEDKMTIHERKTRELIDKCFQHLKEISDTMNGMTITTMSRFYDLCLECLYYQSVIIRLLKELLLIEEKK
jgi:hypothetical protein